MKIGKRGQITIPKSIRDALGLGPETEVEFVVVDGVIQMKRALSKLNLRRWKGYCSRSFEELGYESVDKFMTDLRG